MAIPGDVGINRLITRPWAADEAELVFYVRPGGDDNNDGLTALTAFATFPRAMRELDLYSVNRSCGIDCTGMTIDLDELVQSGGAQLGSINSGINLAATSPNNFFSKRNRFIRSELNPVIAELDVTAQAFDPITGLITLTVSDALAPNQLVGMFAVGAVLGEYGVIGEHTDGAGPNTILVANQVGLTEPVGAYEPGASITTGDAADFFEQCWNHNALADWTFQGLSILHPDGKVASITVWPNAPVTFTLCAINGMTLMAGGGVVTIDACHIQSFFAQDGATCSVTQSFFQNVDFLCHGSGSSGLNEWVGSIFRGCAPFGGGNIESRYTFFMTGCDIAEGTGAGVQVIFGTSRLVDCEINDCVGSGVYVDQQATVYLDNVQSSDTPNGDFGCEAYFGSFVRNFNGTSVTGAGGDIVVGALGVQTWAAVSGAALTDLDQLVRAGAL
jgi:hypothetical protein